MAILSIFGKTRKSNRVNGECSICKRSIEFLYFPVNMEETLMLYSYAHLDTVNVCKGCGAFWHVRCAIKRHDESTSAASDTSQEPTFFQALKQAVEGGERERSNFLNILHKKTTDLNFPTCGSFASTTVFFKEDSTPIKVRSGKRVD